jgi:hypothetical protein
LGNFSDLIGCITTDAATSSRQVIEGIGERAGGAQVERAYVYVPALASVQRHAALNDRDGEDGAIFMQEMSQNSHYLHFLYSINNKLLTSSHTITNMVLGAVLCVASPKVPFAHPADSKRPFRISPRIPN